jgi:DNA polymerase/3'-5' exonuclease PolX
MEFIMGIEKTISLEMHESIVEELFQMRNLYLLRIQELIEDGKYEEAIQQCQTLIK